MHSATFSDEFSVLLANLPPPGSIIELAINSVDAADASLTIESGAVSLARSDLFGFVRLGDPMPGVDNLEMYLVSPLVGAG